MLSNFSRAEEDHVKAVYKLQQHDQLVTTNEIAAALNTKAASVTDMLKRLKQKKLLNYKPYQGVRLSDEGRKLALNIVRRHRLWEFFLTDKLQFEWDEVHAVAEELEHISSKKLIDQLDSFLDHPKFDPHGDPIPDANGKILVQQQVNLAAVELNRLAEITSVTEQSTELLDLLKHKNIGIGVKLEVKKRFSFDNSLEIKMKGHAAENISQQLAQVLFVKYV